MKLIDTAKSCFEKNFCAKSTAYGCAPGRVEVLGNHTDYNEGFILSAAIDRHVVICGRAVPGENCVAYSAAFDKRETFSLRAPQKNTENFWVNYLAGVVDQLQKSGVALGGFEAVVISDVPLGAGVSSSAAIEVATAYFLKKLFPFEMTTERIALTCQAAENKFVGVNCGILDQFSSAMGKQDHLIFLDCRDLSKVEHIPLGSGAALVLANTCAKHDLAEGTYNRLREDCFAAARFFADQTGKQISHLRDVTLKDFEKYAGELPPDLAQRARHVITENLRVLAGIAALRRGDLAEMGVCMSASHASSRDDFGNSCKELDIMTACAAGISGGYGCRLSGGGFGGCTINLVQANKAESFARELKNRYEEKTGLQPELYLCRAVDGAIGGSC